MVRKVTLSEAEMLASEQQMPEMAKSGSSRRYRRARP